MTKVILDTNIYVGWIRDGRFETLLLDRNFVRHLSSVVYMELQAGARTRAAARALERMLSDYRAVERIALPPLSAYARGGTILRELRARGQEVRSAALVNDVMIAMTARFLGATLYTADADFDAIHDIESFDLMRVRAG